MRISDWSSDVCSSDLHRLIAPPTAPRQPEPELRSRQRSDCGLTSGGGRRSWIGPHPGHPAHGWPGRWLGEVETNAIAHLQTTGEHGLDTPDVLGTCRHANSGYRHGAERDLDALSEG